LIAVRAAKMDLMGKLQAESRLMCVKLIFALSIFPLVRPVIAQSENTLPGQIGMLQPVSQTNASVESVHSALEPGQPLSTISSDHVAQSHSQWFDHPNLAVDSTLAGPRVVQPPCDAPIWEFGGLARVSYFNDQRIEFTGQEATFAAEAQILASATTVRPDWQYSLRSETYLTQPFDDNILVDLPVRRSFAGNFDEGPLEISQLYLTATRGSWSLDAGRFVTPFGRYYAPIQTNGRNDTPFIRSESILFRETGFNVRFEPGIYRMAFAGTNGSDGKDTNSSKAAIGRMGVECESFICGASFKWQDGNGSESQKEYNNHAGIDCMVRHGCWSFASEVIYDQYGMRRPGIDLNDITWGRSLYNRQLNNGVLNPITGVGWYLMAIYENQRWLNVLSYGEFHPETIDDPIHDIVSHRLLGKTSYRLTENLSCFVHCTFENSLQDAHAQKERKGVFLLSGMQFDF
jgi:hypothetical protein